MKGKLAFCGAMLLVCLCACGKGDAPAPAPTPEEVPEVFVQTDTGEIKDKETVQLTWEMDQAAVTGVPGAEGINDSLAAGEADFTDHVEELGRSAKELFDSHPDWTIPFESILRVTPARVDTQVVSFAKVVYDYTGGAHGLEGTLGEVYDAQTGEQLTLAALTEDEAALREFLTEQILTQSKSGEFGGGAAFFPGYEDAVPGMVEDGRWYFDGAGIVFTAQPYELAAYAAGMIPFTVTYGDLQGHISDKWIPTA